MTGTGPKLMIGVGASAGGLAALRAFLAEFPKRLGGSVIVLQHLDPDRESRLTALLDKTTALEVREAAEGERLRPDTIHVTPPGTYVEIAEGGLLRLVPPPEDRLHRTPIDHLFRQIAERFGPNAVGVVLSGTGSDATQGIRDIKSAGGAVLVQDPEEAEFDGMPRSAINTGLVDHVAAAAALPRTIARLAQHVSGTEPESAGQGFAERHHAEIGQVLRLLNDRNGFDFSEYKPGTVGRRIRRRMGISDVDSLAAYVELLERTGRERELLVKDLMIGVTRFFRDPAAWETIAKEAIDPVLSAMSDGDTIRAWAAGCSTGEEAYTLGMILMERIQRTGKDIRPLIFASDLNRDAVEQARLGRYPASAVDDVAADRVETWFERLGHEVRVRPRLREKLVFAVQNAVSDPPFSGLDLISCRNLLIYLEPSAQKRIFETFHFSLKPNGFLMLGLSEGAERADPWFTPVDKRNRIFRRTDTERRMPTRPAGRWAGGPRAATAGLKEEVSGADHVVRAMLQRFAPPAVLVDQNFEIKRMHGDLKEVLDFSSGAMSGSLPTLLAPPFQTPAWSALSAARNSNQPSEAPVLGTDQSGGPGKIVVDPLDGRSGREYLVYFVTLDPAATVPGAPASQDAPSFDYQKEMDALRHELQSVIEQGEASSEELQAANEEVLSANEELQSSNEELETSREELQSLNEELSTINTELEEKVRELEATNDDLTNLISSTDIATLFLDTDLTIRRFSARTTELVAIRDADVGRPITELNFKVEDEMLLPDARRVLESLEPAEREISGADYSYLRRIVPYRTRKDQIQGVVITYSDVQRIRVASERLAVQAVRQASIAELSELALSPGALDELYDRIVNDIADHLETRVVEVQLLTPDRSQFRLVAGRGWPRGVAGHAMSANDPDQHLGFTLGRQQLVEVDDITAEQRFAATQILGDTGVTCGVCLCIGTPQAPRGVLCAWRDAGCNFNEEERNYLRTVAKILWLAINHSETQRLRERETQALQDLIDGLPVMVALVDDGFRIGMSNRTFERMGLVVDEVRNAPLETVFGTAAIEALRAASPDARDGAVRFETLLPIPGHGERTFLMHCAPRNAEGRHEGYYIAAIDIDERKRWEERNKVISAELDHRVKNILSLVNTIARMTGRTTGSFREFQSVFAARIQSLSRTHSALAQMNWDGIDLKRLVRDELEAYGSGEFNQYDTKGPPVQVGPAAAQSLALAVHELATNAAKYGALSRPGGRLDVAWDIDETGLRLRWIESGLTLVSEPEAKGFGSTVIRSAVETQLEGKMDVRFEPSGVAYEFSIPAAGLTSFTVPT
ncbi:chemotaxis protein CheB [Marinovum sp.]|uniref:chemotaxis protein CheB n=1 Tax=Marinovum sp. TaxID=2024839 RepID=UPI002B277A45|nr:chemotaxis protein CheB [Marinovum sp.]